MLYTVRQGDCLSSIAKQHGLGDWRTIYDHPQNAALRASRPNPNIICPGDILFVPDRTLRWENARTKQRHRFEIGVPRQLLRLVVQDADGIRIANTAYELTVDGQAFTGTTDGNGQLEAQIAVDAREGRLRTGAYEWELKISHLNPMSPDSVDGGVSGAQARLKNLGFDVGPIDGIRGGQTEAALEAFQRKERLEVTGMLDDDTRARLESRHGC